MKLLAILTAFIFCTAQAQKHYPIGNMLGAVAHPWDIVEPIGMYEAGIPGTQRKINAIVDMGITSLRIYNNSYECKSYDNTSYRLSPDERGFRGDSGIALLKAKAPVSILYCYQNAPVNIQQDYTNAGERNTAYVRRGADRMNPASYSELAHDMAVLAGRGGTNKNVPDYPLYQSQWWYEPLQQNLKGAGIYDMLEPQNELDNNWSNTKYFDGYQYSVLWQACYDSIKAVDPNIVVSSSGVMSGEPDILRQALSTGRKMFDKYQFHCYGSGAWAMNIACAMPPELTTSQQAKRVVAVAGNIPCIIGEWGYDLNPHSQLGVIAFGNYSGEQIRTYWSARALLDFARIGIESAYYYKLYQDYGRDADSSGNLFATTSLMVDSSRRLVGDMFKQMTQFSAFTFDKAIIDNDSVKLYVFRSGNDYLYTGWTVEKYKLVQLWGANRAAFTERKYNYTLNLGGIRYDIAEDSSGQMVSQPFYGGEITLSSKPLFIVSSQILPIYEPPPPAPKPDEKFNVEVFNYVGQLLMKRKNVTVKEMEAELPSNRYFILKYWNANKFFTDKIFKR